MGKKQKHKNAVEEVQEQVKREKKRNMKKKRDDDREELGKLKKVETRKNI